MTIKNNELTKKFGLKIKLERIKRGISQEKFAEMSNLSKNFIGAIERGQSSPSLETIGQIAKALNMEIRELIDSDKVDL